MPEAPQMQALAERLEAVAGGLVLQQLQPLQFSALKTFDPDPQTLVGRTLEHVSRRGKFLVLHFGGGIRMLVHLSQGGRVDVEEPPKATRPKQGVLRMVYETDPSGSGQHGPGILVKEWGTERKAGWWVLGPGEDGPLTTLGPEVDSKAFSELIRTSADRRRVHTVLRDQHTVAGIGRGYTDDILHRSGISPYASLASLRADQRERLLAAAREVLEQGLERERHRTGGLPNKLGDGWIVHHAHGQPCPTCGTALQRVSYESYEVTYCPTCQTDGKVLADRRLSRLLK